ncbi:MAG: hypothetical protein HY044_02190 [Candidatus Woesebacteria bacterium]|nr:MAG: hypothetical protein HY044_02190 [Candidatus Woesebacteria bacterium]
MHITELVQLLDAIPNSPFHTISIESAVLNLLRQLGLSIGKSYLVKIHSDPYGVYLRVRHSKADTKFVWVSHLDHPAIVFDKNGQGHPVGSLGGVGVRGISHIKQGQHPVQVYSPVGELIQASSCEVKGSNLQLVNFDSLPSESVGIWDIETRITQEAISMRSADNHIPTIVALQALERLVANQAEIDVTLILNSVEEVYQLSMMRQMAQKGIPEIDLDFDNQTIFVVLEAMEMMPNLTFSQLNLVDPTYTDGVLLKVNDTSVVFGQLSGSEINRAEAIMLNALNATERKFQYTVSSGTSDATAISIFAGYSNIVCLAIPCRNKHNVSETGEITTEEVLVYDVDTAIEALIASIKVDSLTPSQMLSTELKMSGLMNLSMVDEALVVRKRLLKRNAPRIEHRFYLANTILRKAMLVKAS